MPMLEGGERFALEEALLETFPTSFELGHLLHRATGTPLTHVVGEGRPLPQVVYEIVRHVEARDETLELVQAARRARPRSRKLARLAVGLDLTPLEAPAAPALEEVVVARDPMLDIHLWRTRLGEIEGRVCRIELPSGGGTGFLVGPDLVLTNHHVVRRLLAGQVAGADVAVRFDAWRTAAGHEHPGTVVRLAASFDVTSSPHDPADVLPLSERTAPVAPGNLDYAVLRLAGPVGEEPREPLPQAPPRGWLALPDAVVLEPGEKVLILQHPLGGPLKLALNLHGEGVLGWFEDGLRLRYDTNTMPGSSGSPVLDLALSPVALHHSGEITLDAAIPSYNEGIPLAAIKAHLAGAGLSLPSPP